MGSQKNPGVLGSIVLATGLAACSPYSPTGPTGGSRRETPITTPAPVPAPTPAPVPAPGSGASGPTGSYLLTMTASPICDAVTETHTGQIMPLPEAVRTRQYTAEFADGTATLKSADGTRNTIVLGGVDTYVYPGRPLMTLNGNELTIVVPPEDGRPLCAGGDYSVEVLDSSG